MLLLEIERDAFFCLIFCSFILCQQALMFCHSLSQQMKAIMPRSIIKMVLLQVIAVHIFHIYFLWSGPTPDMKADLSSFYHLSSIWISINTPYISHFVFFNCYFCLRIPHLLHFTGFFSSYAFVNFHQIKSNTKLKWFITSSLLYEFFTSTV